MIGLMRRLAAATIMAMAIIMLIPLAAHADAQEVKWFEKTMPYAYENINGGILSSSYMSETQDGYQREFYDGKKIYIESYDTAFKLTKSGVLEKELPLWGGFYAGQDAYYIVEGQNNTEEDTSKEVIRVIKYDKNWKRLGAASITGDERFGGQVRYPFDAGCVNIAELNGYLYLVTGHEGYVDDAVGQGHQGFLMIKIDKTQLTGNIIDCDLSHSFSQHIIADDGGLYTFEESEGSYYSKLSKFDPADGRSLAEVPVLRYGGQRTSAWAVATYASADDLAASSNSILCVGTSIDQSKYSSVTTDTPHNVYLTVTPKNNMTEEATELKWLTNFTGNGKCFLGLNITKITDDRFLICWEEQPEEESLADAKDSLSRGNLHYIFVDGSGNMISREFVQAACVSDCKPILSGGKVIYYAANANMVDFYTIEADTGAFQKVAYRTVGFDATWDVEGDVITISGKGDITVNSEASHRYPLSATKNIYSLDDNCWKFIRDGVKTIRIEEGITSIPEDAFCDFSDLYTINIADGLKSIGKRAFYGNLKLRELYIPGSVTEIGDDIAWTGYTWTHDGSKVVYATIYTTCTSYASKYAEENGIRTSLTHANLVKTEAVPATCTEDGTIEYWTCTGKDDCCGHMYSDEECRYEVKEAGLVDKATGHKWQTDWDKTDDETHTMVCVNDSSHTITEKHTFELINSDPADCYFGAEDIYRCECGKYKYVETSPALGHDWGNWVPYDENYHERTCNRNEYHKDYAFHNWNNGVIIKDATENEEGEIKYTCQDCGAERTEVIPIITHDHVLVKTEARAATCEEDGNIDYWTCKECKRIYADSEAKKQITIGDTVIKAYGHSLTHYDMKAPTCEEDGNKEYWACDGGDHPCGKYFADAKASSEIKPADVIIPKLGHDFSAWTPVDAEQHRRICANDNSHIETAPHTWDSGVVTKEATETEQGEKLFTCTACGATKTEAVEWIPPEDRMGEDGTPIGKGASFEAADKAITSLKSDNDPAGSKVAPLFVRSTKQTKNSIKLTWKKPAGAKTFVLYGNKCGKKNKMKKIKTLTKTSITVKKAVKKLAKGKYYKFIVVSLDADNNVVSTSKIVHACTKGGKVANFKSVKTKAKKNKVTLKVGKAFKLSGKGVPASKKLKVKKHVGIRYESANTDIATVSKKSIIKAKKKGSCYVYAYSQNGTYAKIKVTVK